MSELFLQEISRLLDALPPQTIRRPVNGAKKNEKVLGRLHPYLQRLHELRLVLNDQVNEVGGQLKDISAEALTLIPADASNAEILAIAAGNPRFVALMAQAEKLKLQHEQLIRKTKLVDEIFWHDVRVVIPEAEDKPQLHINEDWDVVASDKLDTRVVLEALLERLQRDR